jgi:hypothetical protein
MQELKQFVEEGGNVVECEPRTYYYDTGYSYSFSKPGDDGCIVMVNSIGDAIKKYNLKYIKSYTIKQPQPSDGELTEQ